MERMVDQGFYAVSWSAGSGFESRATHTSGRLRGRTVPFRRVWRKGRRARFRSWWAQPVGVRVPPPAPELAPSHFLLPASLVRHEDRHRS